MRGGKSTMDTEGGPLPAKRPRTTFNGNVQLTQLTECIREFKLPRQYPSMASKLQSSSNDKNKTRANFNGRVVSLPKGQTINAKIIRQNNTIPVSTIIRKIKLKGKDGRDLGEVNVQHLPQNIKGKTITIAKNSMKLQNNLSIPIKDNVKGVTIGILTPVNLVPTENKSESPRPIVKTQMHTLDKYFHCEKEKERNIRLTEQKKTGNIVFQLGKSWHTVKVSGAKYPDIKAGTITLLGGKMDKVSSDVHPIDNEVNKTVANVQNIGENCQSDKKTSQQPAKNLKMMVTRRISDGVTVQQKSPISRENSEVAKNERPKIEISRIYGPSSIKVLPEAQKSKVPALKRDVMVVLPESMGDLGIDITKTNSSLEVNSKTPSPVETDSPSNAWKKKLLATRNINKEQAKADKEMTSQLSIVQKALSTVEDKELRAKALRALAECGIGIERFVTIREPADQRPVKDSATQTQIFGLWDPDRFINVPNEKPTIERIKIHEKPQLNYNMSHFSDEAFSTLSLDTLDIPKWRRIEAESTCHLADAVAGFLKGNEGAEQVKNIFAQPHGVHPKVKAQLEKDLKTYNQFDDNGLLSIHRAVQDNDINAVARLLKILRLCRESVDIPTRDGQVSIAASYNRYLSYSLLS